MIQRCSKARRLVYVLDGDRAALQALSSLLALEGFTVSAFESGDEFLAAARERPPDCIILDAEPLAVLGRDMLRELDAASFPAPVLAMSPRGDIRAAVRAVKGGALDVLEKPLDPSAVLSRVREALDAAPPVLRPEAESPDAARGQPLTLREREVLDRIAGGASNKEVGRLLGISPRTVEVHRARIMEKLGARNTADLVRIVLSRQSGNAR